eukprot:TRINITY_DN9982_c0_g1_i14.p1 TRINITY_DN9982_c0_g1~~TRINITY_DN9982_c0_g1_i14.p1  ORF type:complete len:150 (+),score=31.99 TRINITY_DN9982_c0_g1_i14:174-623(+)
MSACGSPEHMSVSTVTSRSRAEEKRRGGHMGEHCIYTSNSHRKDEAVPVLQPSGGMLLTLMWNNLLLYDVQNCATHTTTATTTTTTTTTTTPPSGLIAPTHFHHPPYPCLLYTSDAADEEDSVDLGGRRIIKKKKKNIQIKHKNKNYIK